MQKSSAVLINAVRRQLLMRMPLVVVVVVPYNWTHQPIITFCCSRFVVLLIGFVLVSSIALDGVPHD
jgi:hypothetical protein